ncbi:UDP-3-O-acyl-N-acetylglucosamine deacetylase [Oceanibaculum pacificum]|uniref:UDP-3-O-acyl-N-acetylglucosamine deacetylase n=1 Tax=Oceanibaculum pacificum TaxID=580166 RepID=UPI000A04F6E1|nr:UDP-3-O-acyl-N-acetylglucosamine deacetylase [Oceanibaculum pacificum]
MRVETGIIDTIRGLNGTGPGSSSTVSTIRQKTLRNPISCAGVGLHSGAKVVLTLLPAAPDTGILFRRTDVTSGSPDIPAHYENVVDTRLCTMLGNEDGVTISTIEHLMAALAGCEIDNAIIEVSGPEVPIMDGSAQPFVFLIECAGTEAQRAPRRAIRVLKPITVRKGDAVATLLPGNGFSVNFEIDFDSKAIARQTYNGQAVNGVFKSEISRARTFGFAHEVEAMRKAGLGRGGSLANAVVVDGDKILNEEGLRYDDEFVRHKVLDAVGDLYLAGAPIIGRFHGVRTGHMFNNQVLHALFADPTAWEEVEMTATDRYGHAPTLAATA